MDTLSENYGGVIMNVGDLKPTVGQGGALTTTLSYWTNLTEHPLQNAPMVSATNRPNHTKSELWRNAVSSALRTSGMEKDALSFDLCEKDFQVDVCTQHPDHAPRIVPFTCKLRYCPWCEKRESARKLRRYYLPILGMLDQQLYGYELRKVVLTTPFDLYHMTSAQYAARWDDLKRFLELFFYRQLLTLGKLSKSEIRRGRADLKKHGIGVLAAAEFGERGKKLHFHLLMYCNWIDQKNLTETWKEATNYLCQVTHVSGCDKSDLVGAVQEIVKYITKFSSLPARLVPRLAAVLKGNRRVRSYGLLNCIEASEEEEHERTCETCFANRRLVPLASYIMRCEAALVPLDDAIIDRGEARWRNFSSDIGNKSGESGQQQHKARDSLSDRS